MTGQLLGPLEHDPDLACMKVLAPRLLFLALLGRIVAAILAVGPECRA